MCALHCVCTLTLSASEAPCGAGAPFFPLVHLLPHLFPLLLFSFFHWLYLFSSFVHPFPFYQNSPLRFQAVPDMTYNVFGGTLSQKYITRNNYHGLHLHTSIYTHFWNPSLRLLLIASISLLCITLSFGVLQVKCRDKD